jgi:hypothetical protein
MAMGVWAVCLWLWSRDGVRDVVLVRSSHHAPLSCCAHFFSRTLTSRTRRNRTSRYVLWGSVGTADYYSSEHNIPITDLTWMQEDVVVIGQELADGNFDLVINVALPTKRKSRRPAQGAVGTSLLHTLV